MAKFNLKTMPGIERPAIAGLWPTLKGQCIVLDLGASIGADAEHLVDLAVMGSAMARVLFDLDRPSVGLLNIGVEEVKGLEPVREAGRILREDPPPHIEYVGFVEGDDIGKGKADVVVTEGFAGNIALKTAEGTARQFADYLRNAISQSVWSKLGYLLARPAFRMLRDKMDPRKSNGGVFLGLNGVVIKSHGGTDAEGFAAAIDMGYDMVRYELLAKIGETIHRHTRRNRRRAHARRGGLVSMLRSVVLGCGSYLPAASSPMRNSPRPSTPPTNGSCSAPASASAISRRDGELTSDLAIQAAKAALASGPCRSAIDRSDRAGHLDARQHISGRRRDGAGRASASPAARRSICRRSARALSIGLADRRRPAAHRHLQARAGDRRGDILAHSRLEGPHHLRAVRRRRRRGGDGGAAAARRPRRSRRPDRRICAPTAGTRPSFMSTAGRPRRRPWAICAWKGARCSSTRSP